MTLRQTMRNDTDSADRISAFFSDFFLLTAVSGTFAYWITLFTRWPLGTMYPLFLVGMLGGGSIILRSGSGNYQIFPKGRAAYFLYAIAFLCMLVGLFTIRPDGDDLAHFHRALSSANHLDKAIPLFTTYYDLEKLPELSAPHTLASYEFFMALWAKSFSIRGIYFIHTVGGLLPLFLAPIVYFRLSRSLEFTLPQALALGLLTFCFILLSSTSNYDWANFTILRCWVGKCLYMLILLPIMWDVAVRYINQPGVPNLLRLHGVMIASLGLTSSAFFLTPYMLAMFFFLSLFFFKPTKERLVGLSKASSILLLPGILTIVCLSGFFPPVKDLTVWSLPLAEWTREKQLMLFFGKPMIAFIPVMAVILCFFWQRNRKNLQLFFVYVLVSSALILTPFLFESVKDVAKSSWWRLLYVFPVPFIMAVISIIMASSIKKCKFSFSILCCLVLCLFIWSKVSFYKKEFFITSPTLFKEYPHSAEIAELISKLTCGADSIVVAPYYPDMIATAIGIFSPDNVRFLTTLFESDRHLLRNSPYIDELETRKKLNNLFNQYAQNRDEKSLLPFLHKIDFLIIQNAMCATIEDILKKNGINYLTYNLNSFTVYHLKS